MSALSRLRAPLRAAFDVDLAERGRVAFTVAVGERRQVVRLTEIWGWIRVESRIGDFQVLRSGRKSVDLHRVLFEFNRSAEGVSLQVDENRRVVAACDLPGQVPEGEVVEAVRRVAATADRWELLWTGEDRE